MTSKEIKSKLLDGLTEDQKKVVQSIERKVLVVAGAGSGKTEVMARRIAWWIGVEGISKEQIVAFTFTEKAASEMKLRVRHWITAITPPEEDVNMGGMYVGTIHGFCIAKLREYWPDNYHNFDILDEASREALILRGFNGILGLHGLRNSLGKTISQTETIKQFMTAYDQLHEHNKFDISLSSEPPPYNLGEEERDWCKEAYLLTNVGNDSPAKSFSLSAARYYAYLRCRRFLDFSTSQTEFLKNLTKDEKQQNYLSKLKLHLVVDEVQDINPVQRDLIFQLIGEVGNLTAVGDHRQSIYGFRGAKVEILGKLWQQFIEEHDAEVIDLQHNFRSTPRVIEIANKWAKTINPAGGMRTPDMLHGLDNRKDTHHSHISLIKFSKRQEEANWIADAIKAITPNEDKGVAHYKRGGGVRGLALSDIAVLVRSSTDIRVYMEALESKNIPVVVRAGPDLFSQPEVLLFIGALALTADIDEFYGSNYNNKSLPARINNVLGCLPKPDAVLHASAFLLRKAGLEFTDSALSRLILASKSLKSRIIDGDFLPKPQVAELKNNSLKAFLTRNQPLRRVFPQQLYHWLMEEAEVEKWDICHGRGEAAMFHLGSLSKLIMGMETPGWTSSSDYKWQIIGLCQYGAEGGRDQEQPLMVKPDAVSISTIHSAKGLEFPAVFLADVCARRFPSQLASRAAKVPLSGNIVAEIDISGLSDNSNKDGERRLMYVALTRSERFLAISSSGSQTSSFIKELTDIVRNAGGSVTDDHASLLSELRYAPIESLNNIQISTSFSDLRYYLGCPHDFYLRKVLGFNPTIDQAFGYGRGVHNLLRAIHSDPEKWAEFAENRKLLESEIKDLIQRGLFYLRYTTGNPADNMRQKGVKVVSDYVESFVDELRSLTFEPEKEFETVLEYEDDSGEAMISGAIDIVRKDDPPRVTLIDFKSGHPESDNQQKLDEDEMRLQVAIYAIAAKKELQYQPEQGLVRYLGAENEEERELKIPLDPPSVDQARKTVLKAVTSIRDREFNSGPQKPNHDGNLRCSTCDFSGICGKRT